MVSMANPIDLTRPAEILAAATPDDVTRAHKRRQIWDAAQRLHQLVRESCVGSGEVVRVEWDRITLMGCVEQNGSLGSQPGYLVVNVGPENTWGDEMARIRDEIWGDYWRALRPKGN